jgi:hypothetical protein
MNKKIIIALLVLVIIISTPLIFYYVLTPCCKPMTGFGCRFCPGISDNQCESWVTKNEGICIREGSNCPVGYDIMDRYPCSDKETCCLPIGFEP